MKSNMQASPVLKYRSASKVDPKTGKNYHVALVLRENGAFESYSDFLLVNQFYDKRKQCVDIATDFSQFFLKFVRNSDLVDESYAVEDLEFRVRNIRHIWRNQISYNTSRRKNRIEKWDWIIH